MGAHFTDPNVVDILSPFLHHRRDNLLLRRQFAVVQQEIGDLNAEAEYRHLFL
jgi:hypothetical protein